MVADRKIPPLGADFASARTMPGVIPGAVPDDASARFADAKANVNAAIAAGQRYLAAQADRLKLALRTVGLLLGVAILGGAFVTTLFITAAVLLMMGIADALAALLGGRQWAGDLITGGGVVLVVGLIGYIVIARFTKASRLKTVESYQSQIGH